MGCIDNITYDSFPQQKGIGNLVDLGQGTFIPAFIVRCDDEEPHRTIYKTLDGKYVQDSDLPQLVLPKQGIFTGKPVGVCFHYDTTHMFNGRIVRDDYGEPYAGFIELTDGRVISFTECQYRIEDDFAQPTPTRTNAHIERLQTRLKKLDTSEKARELHGIYKQLVPSRKGRMANGPYQEYCSQKPIVGSSIEDVAEQIIALVNATEFANYVADQMDRHNHLHNHAQRIREQYHDQLKINLQTINPTTN